MTNRNLTKRVWKKYGINATNATIADILYIAANDFLDSEKKVSYSTAWYSCNAVLFAIKAIYDLDNWYSVSRHHKAKQIMAGLRQMGLRPGSAVEFNEFQTSHGVNATQQARYAWLMFAYEIALEQGV